MLRKLLRASFVLALLVPGWASAQVATISGTVTDPNGEALPGANVLIEELVIGAATDVDGRYSFEVPSEMVNGQTVTLRARFVGYTPQTRRITLTPGAQTQDFTLAPDLLKLDEVVVTGVTGATPQKKLAFTVSKLDASAIELAPASSPVGSMQGKIAGASVLKNSGQPGSGYSVRLRGSTSITGSSAPLFIVDGVILGADQVDLGALDIESMEVVKGAAASSLYGSRAQNGVINITTKRGSNVPLNQTRVTIRNEFGISDLPKSLRANSAHSFKIDSQGRFLNANGEVNSCDNCLDNGFGPGVLEDKILGGVSFYDKKYSLSGPTYNAFDDFFDPGDTYSNYISVSQNSASTNFHVSFTNLKEGGVVVGTDGYNQQNFLMNLDHRVSNKLSVSASGRYSQSQSDDVQRSGAINPFFGLMFTSPIVNLARRDENGQLFVKADPLAVEENPLYIVENTDIKQERSRLLGNFRVKYQPTDWVDLEGTFSYDRLDADGTTFMDRGFQTIDPSSINDGQIQRRNSFIEALNADVTASFHRTFGKLTARSQLKYQLESDDEYFESLTGTGLTSLGIKDLSNVKQFPEGARDFSSTKRTIRADGLYATLGFDYEDKYIGDFLIRRDGSSLFGAEERWQTYYRAAFAYRVSEESWWPFKDAIDEFKLRGSVGTAGGRPQFEAQYEVFSLSNGTISKATLGNKFLKPELSTEVELGLEMSFLDRFFLEAVYADSEVKDQLLQVPLAGYFGFSSQWQNAGTLTSNTVELSLNANLFRSRDVSWDLGVTFDRTRQEITRFDANPFRGGPRTAFFFRSGEILGAMYGFHWLSDPSELPEGANPAAWDVNDDGYLVPVGVGNTFRDGFTGNCGLTDENGNPIQGCWGALVDTDGDGEGDSPFGLPVKFETLDENGNPTQFVQIGDVLPDFNLGFNTTFRYKGLTAYMLWNAQIGGDVYNFTKQWSYRDGRSRDQDQSEKPDDLKKPINYYEVLYDATAINDHFIEDGTYLKLREVSLGYTFSRQVLQRYFGNALNQVSISLIGRNLLTISDYSGFDPEVGTTSGGAGVGGDASLYRVDNFGYPLFRSLTGKLEIQF